MARRTVTFAADDTRNFVANHKRGDNYHASIQNNTDQSITVTVTNQNIQGSNPVFSTPASGALVIAVGDAGELDQPYDGWLLTAAMTATGTVDIVEAG